MTRLRFIKSWGPYKSGDLHEPKNTNTVHMLVEVYKFAVIEPDVPAKIEVAPEPEPGRDFYKDFYKYVRKPQQHKMVTGPQRAKNITED